MAFVDTFLGISIKEAAALTQATSTTIPLLIGKTDPKWEETDFVHAYTSPSDMLSDGFTASSPEYVYATALCSGNPAPQQFLVGRRSGTGEPAVAQEDEITVGSEQATYVYKVTIGGTLYSYTSGVADTAQTILSGLFSSITNDAASPVAPTLSVDGNTLTLKAKIAGATIAYTAVDANLEVENTKEAEQAQAETLSIDDLESINAQDTSWYCVVAVQASDEELATLSAWVEPQRKIYIAMSGDLAIAKATSTDDVLAKLKAKSVHRTAVVLSQKSTLLGLEAALVGARLPLTPGTATWSYAGASGFVPDKFSNTQLLTLLGNKNAGVYGKNANVFHVPFGNEGVFQFGTMADGTSIDTVVNLDWIYFNLQAAMYNLLTVNSGKIAYDDAGMTLIENGVFGVLSEAAANGILDAKSIQINVPKVSSVSAVLKKLRKAPTVTWSAQLLGAIEAITISGNVTY